MTKVTVSRMAAESTGYWSWKKGADLLKWKVAGPGVEVQKFGTKRDATLYAKCRRNSESHAAATAAYCATA